MKNFLSLFCEKINVELINISIINKAITNSSDILNGRLIGFINYSKVNFLSRKIFDTREADAYYVSAAFFLNVVF